MKRRRPKRKMATRKKTRRGQAVVVREPKPINYRVALPPGQRRLSFGDRWAYAPAPEASNYIKIKPRYQLFIGGKFVAPRSGKYFGSINPATEEKLAEIADANRHDVDLAVKSAGRAYNNVWKQVPGTWAGEKS